MSLTAPLHLMTESIVIERATESLDAGGSPTRTWSEHLTGVAARVTQKTQNESPASGGRVQEQRYTVIISAGLDVRGTDRIKWTKGGVDRYIKISGPPRDASGMNAILIIDGVESKANG